MRKLILYFVLSLGYFALVVTIYAVGFEYDKAYKLYPETVKLSYDLAIVSVHGQRWVRFLQKALALGVFIDFVIAAIWYLKRPVKGASLKIDLKQ